MLLSAPYPFQEEEALHEKSEHLPYTANDILLSREDTHKESNDPYNPQCANSWHQVELCSTFHGQYAFKTGEVSEQVGNLFQLSFEPKIRLCVCACSASLTSCLQARGMYRCNYIFTVTVVVHPTPQL